MFHRIVSVVVLTLLSSSVWAAKDRGGGDEVALEFIEVLAEALADIKATKPELQVEIAPLDLAKVAETARILVTNEPLIVDNNGVLQESVAVNDPSRNLIIINRQRWKDSKEKPYILRAISIHESSSLKHVETTGRYPLSGKYLILSGLKPDILEKSTGKATADIIQRVEQIPEEFMHFESITINGAPGAKQAATFSICHVKSGQNGYLPAESTNNCTSQPLNRKVSTPAGTYVIHYSSSAQLIQLNPGEHKVIELRRISIPYVDGTYRFSVFADYTNAEEQEKFIKLTWIRGFALEISATNCAEWRKDNWPTMTPDIRKICNAWRGKDPRALKGTAYRFRKDGSILYATSDYVTYQTDSWHSDPNYYVIIRWYEDGATRRYIGDGSDGDFISLLPGVYGIIFTTSTGITKEKFGVRLD